MIVFGGAGLNGVANADIHILDMPTREWTLGKSANATQARRNMACAASGDSFVAWGGIFSTFSVSMRRKQQASMYTRY